MEMAKGRRAARSDRATRPVWIGALLALALALAACDGHESPRGPEVSAGGEHLVGAHGVRFARVVSFKGVPYAAPPTGKLRWQPPRPHRPRPGSQPATHFAAGCYQDGYNTEWYRKVGAAFGAQPALFRDPPFSEDCLYLNVWTPALDARARLPVIVWIHGGSNKAGWSFEPNYDGENLAARGHVVVVSIAYRLGVFGFFGHPEITAAGASPNFGLLDQIAALAWVRDEIRAFGGDPSNVTVAGESAGASDIGYLATSPLAAGLFRRAISESGGFQMREAVAPAEAERVGAALTAALPGSPGLAALRQLPSATIFESAAQALPDHHYNPVVDGVALPTSPGEAYRRQGIPVDLLIGTNDHEWYMYVDDDPGGLARDLDALPEGARAALGARAAREDGVRHARDALFTLSEMVCPTYAMATATATAGHRAWVYRFARVRPGPGGERLLAYHGAEIPYVFDTHDRWFSRDGDDDRLTTAMVAYWSNFARVGDPNGPGLAPWPSFAAGEARVLRLAAESGAIPAPDAELCRGLAPHLYPEGSGR